jgi:trans-2,3-dihydro-3-hydroxyanthranilate isomerase
MGGPLEVGTLRLELAAGIVPVVLEREGPRVTFGWMLPPSAHPIEVHDGDAVLSALGVSETASAVAAYSNGPEHILVPLRSARAVSELAPNSGALAAATGAIVSVFHFDGSGVKARVFAPRAGVVEDPATGSAAGPIAAYLHASGLLGDRRELVIEQGLEVGRPSKLHVRLSPSSDLGKTDIGKADAGKADAGTGEMSIEVGGSAFIVARGQFTLPEAQSATGSEAP